MIIMTGHFKQEEVKLVEKFWGVGDRITQTICRFDHFIYFKFEKIIY